MDKFFLVFLFGLMFNDVWAITWRWMDNYSCNKTIDIAGDGQTHIEFESSGLTQRCHVTLETNSGNRFMVFIEKMNVSGNCADNWVELHDGRTRGSPYMGADRFCGYSAPSDVYTTSWRYLTFYFHQNTIGRPSSFSFWITSFHKGTCASDEYKCDNGRCIDSNLQCFGENPCGDNSDCNNFRFTGPIIAGIAVGGIFVVIILVTLLTACNNRRAKVKRRGQLLATARSNLVTAATTRKSDYGYDQPIPQKLEPPSYPGTITTNTAYPVATESTTVSKVQEK